MRPPRSSSPACLLLTAALTTACFTPGGETTSASASSTTTETGTGGTTAPTTGTATSTSGTSTGTTGVVSTTTASTSTGPATTGTTTGTTGTTGTTDTTDTTAATTTGAPVGECLADAACKLHTDCCTCEGVPIDEDVTICDDECKQPLCSEFGVEKAVCRFGVCTTERLSCDETQVVCDAAPPACPPGLLAETTPACYSGKCVPAALCDVVPDCALCPAGTMCVQNIAFGPQGWPWCEPIPPACDGQIDCDCVGDLVCADPFPFCAIGDGVVQCECINC